MSFEPRGRKQKWSADPRNETWARDTDKFGFRMLERMGWSEGQGLGANCQGTSAHVKTTLKSNKLGLGADKRVDYEWLAVQDAYDNVLADLNDDLAAGDDTKEKVERPKPARQGRASRMFYSRFRKGKDLTQYGKEDLAAILGHKSTRPQHLLDEDSSKNSSNASSGEEAEDSGESQDGILTVKAGESVSDYFARRLAEKGLAAAMAQATGHTPPAPPTAPTTTTAPTATAAPTTKADTKAERKKSKKKRKRTEDGSAVAEENATPNNPKQSAAEEPIAATSAQKKKKKSKKRASDAGTAGAETTEVEVAVVAPTSPASDGSSKKKKKSKRRRVEQDEAQSTEHNAPAVAPTPSPKKKKTKQAKEEAGTANGGVINSTGEQSEQAPAAKKKKKSKKNKHKQ
eukprot:m.484467 g.484467  ORF g.484467 m.484467 type:complete len:401 (+) comp23358_c0_seq1:211-1413(+)